MGITTSASLKSAPRLLCQACGLVCIGDVATVDGYGRTVCWFCMSPRDRAAFPIPAELLTREHVASLAPTWVAVATDVLELAKSALDGPLGERHGGAYLAMQGVVRTFLPSPRVPVADEEPAALPDDELSPYVLGSLGGSESRLRRG
jgi:hypothetical protein